MRGSGLGGVPGATVTTKGQVTIRAEIRKALAIEAGTKVVFTQLEAVEALFETATEEPLFVPVTVVLELEWVLRSRYGFDKEAILRAMNGLLEVRELEFQFEPALERAPIALAQL